MRFQHKGGAKLRTLLGANELWTWHQGAFATKSGSSDAQHDW